MIFQAGEMEWLPDQDPVLLPGLAHVENLVPDVGSYRTFPETRKLEELSALDAKVQGAARGRTQSGIPFIVAGTATKLWLSQGVDFVDESLAPYSVSSFLAWRFALQGDILVAVAGPGTAPQRYWFGTDPNFVNLSADASFARHVMAFNQFVVLGDIVGRGVNAATIGSREAGVHWSAIGNPNSWPNVVTQAAKDAQSDFNELPGDGGPITDMASVGEFGIIFRERQVWRVDYVGAPLFLQFRLLSEHHGCVFPYGSITLNGIVYFPSEDGFYAYDGATIVPIGEGKINHFWRDNAGTGLVSSGHDPRTGLLLWTVPGTDLLLGYRYTLRRWTLIRKSVEWLLTIIGGFPSGSLDAAPYATMSMDAASPAGLGDVDLDSLAGSVDELLAAFLLDHALHSYDNTETFVGFIETGDYVDDAEMRRILLRGIRPIVSGEGSQYFIAASARERAYDEVVYDFLDLALRNSQGMCPVRLAGRYVRSRIALLGSEASLKGFEANFSMLGRR